MGVGKSCLLHQFTEGNCKNYLKKKPFLFLLIQKKNNTKKKNSILVCAESPHTIGVEFGTRIIEVMNKKIKLQIVNIKTTKKKKKISKKI